MSCSFRSVSSGSKYIRSNLQFKQGAADSIPLPDASVDIVVSFETLEHHDKHEEMYSEIKRVLRKNGVLIISTPNKHFFSDTTSHRNEYHIKELYLNEFINLNNKYFRKTQFFSQKFALGSLITNKNSRGNLQFYNGNHQSLISTPDIIEPIYHICLASDYEFDSLNASFFDGTILFSNMEDMIFDQQSELDKLRKRVESMGRHVKNMEDSMAMKLGSALLSPIKLLVRGK